MSGTSKFLNPNPKLPDMYALWMELAQIQHKLEPFARGERTPAAINAAREALHHLGTARHELVATEVFVVETLKALDAQHDQTFESWAEQVDRPDLLEVVDEIERRVNDSHTPPDLVVPVEGPNGQQFTMTYKASESSTPNYFHTRPGPMSDADSRYATEPDPQVDLPDLAAPMPIAYRDSNGQPRANADALVGHARRFMDDNSPDCYNCGHPKNAHPLQPGGTYAGSGCGTIVEHGYPCDCLGYAPASPRPVAEIHGEPATWGQLEAINQELDQESADPHECWTCGHGGHQHGPWGCNGGGKDGCQCQEFQEVTRTE